MRWSIGFPAMPPVSLADRPSPPKAPRRAREGRWWFLVSHGLLSSSGSLAMLAAIRRASSRVRRCAAERRPGSSSK
jgi:hypothetical protein